MAGCTSRLPIQACSRRSTQRAAGQIFSLDFKHWPFFSSPTLAGRLLYIGSHQGRVLAVDLKTNRSPGHSRPTAHGRTEPTYTNADGTPNYGAASNDSFYEQMVIGADRMMSVGAVLSTPVIDGNTLYFGSADGQLYAIG